MEAFDITQLDWDLNLVKAFEPSMLASCAGQGTAAEMLQGCQAFEFESGSRRAILAVKPLRRVSGNILDVYALVSMGDRLKVADFDHAVQQVASRFDAKVLQMATVHPHMVRGCQRNGWQITGTMMQKQLQGIQ